MIDWKSNSYEFLTLRTDAPAYRFEVNLGTIPDFRAFVCCYRKEPFFMDACSGTDAGAIPIETQALFIRRSNGYSLLLPLVDEPFRASLRANADGELIAVLETGDHGRIGYEARALYVSHGDNLYTLLGEAGTRICDTLKTCRVRREKALPAMIDLFGWCTWDSFYEHVKKEDIPVGLESFKKGGFVPKFLLLDDGWQSVRPDGRNRGEHKLTSFKANEKFGGQLSDTVAAAKEGYGVEQFYVWHAMMGYWGGIDFDSPEMKPYGVRLKETELSEAMYEVNEPRSKAQEFPFGIVAPESFFAFYNDYHRWLKSEGIDGVKVDVQSAIEGLGHSDGGRVTMARRMREGLEASTRLNFDGGLINCMSCSNDIIYHTKASNLMRSSADFYPNEPDSHGRHIYTNAITSLWMGEFITCDWDMFQTKHEFAAFHAMARAVSGGPVYVSDRVDCHDFSIIERLTTKDGRILRALDCGRPTADSLFMNPYEGGLFKIFNVNTFGGVIGIFNLTGEAQNGALCPADIDGFAGDEAIAYNPVSGDWYRLGAKEALPLALDGRGSAVYTVMPIRDGFAPIGLAGKYNAGGAVRVWREIEPGLVQIECAGEGEFRFFCQDADTVLLFNGRKLTLSDCTSAGGNIYTIQY